jgi:hypothetical protein
MESLKKILVELIRFLLGIPLPVCYIDIDEVSSLLLNEYPDAEIYLPDGDLRCFNETEVAKCWFIKLVSKLTFVSARHDCDDFAAKAFGFFLGLTWTINNKGAYVHALNWFINEKKELRFLEPQSIKISHNLAQWQGTNIKFFMGR